MSIAHAVATRSTCDRKHVGCVLVLDRRIISSGYNGSIPGAPHCDGVGHDLVKVEASHGVVAHNCVRTMHAEANAIAQAARFGSPTHGAHAYVNTFPCWPCFRLLASSGIEHIIYDDDYREDARVRDGAAHAKIVITQLRGCT